MAHTSCYNKHSMWNGDGKPVVYVNTDIKYPLI